MHCRRAHSPAPAVSNSTAFGLGLERRGNLGGARPALEFSIAQLRDEAAQPLAVAQSARAAAPVLVVTCFSWLILCPSLTLEGPARFTRYSFAWLAV
jgi:hypothetical protein